MQWFPPNANQSIHCLGVAGSGMKRLAEVLTQMGWKLTGSDDAWEKSPSENILSRCQVMGSEDLLPAATGQVIHSLAIPADHPQMQQAKSRGLSIHSYPQVLGELSRQFPTVAVAGSHGKSTTCGMIDWLVRAQDQCWVRLSGAELCEAPDSNVSEPETWSSDCQLVIEACEFQQSFLQLSPQTAVVLNIDHDHVDCYPTPDHLAQAIGQFLNNIEQQGRLILSAEVATTLGEGYWKRWSEQQHAPSSVTVLAASKQETLPEALRAFANVLCYQMSDQKLILESEQTRSTYSLSPQCMTHPINLTAAVCVARESGVSDTEISSALSCFPGLRSRFELLRMETFPHLLFVDDFAHHPQEIAMTIQQARVRFPQRNVIALFEPHQYQRLQFFFDQYVESLSQAEEVFVAPVFRARESHISANEAEKLSTELMNSLHTNGTPATAFAANQLEQLLKKAEKQGAIVLMMSAGKLRADVKVEIPQK